MVHTYEVLVDIRECSDLSKTNCTHITKHYEVHAKSQERASRSAALKAQHEYPQATEFDSRVIGLLK